MNDTALHRRPEKARAFLAHGGEAGERMRAFDWAASPLGPVEGWPQPLRTLVPVMLGSRQPMFLAWGPERTLLYNDGYAEMLGRKHPAALGRAFLDVWPEVRDEIQPLFDQVDAGESVHMDDITLVLDRHGYSEETHFAFSYTPVRDDRGRVVGLFCPCQETTWQVQAERRNIAERAQLEQFFAQAPGFMAMLRGPDHRFELANPAFLRLIGHRDVLHRTVAEALPDAVEQGYLDSLNEVYRSGKALSSTGAKYAVQAMPGGPIDERYADFVYQPVTGPEGGVTGIFVEGSDVTERMHAEKALRESEAFTRRVLESSTDCVKVLDLDARLEFMSAGGMGTMEIDDFGPFKGACWPDFWGGEEHAKALDAVAVAKRGGTGRFQGYAETAKGNMRYWDVIVTPILGDGGAPEKLLSISRDISEQRDAELALRALNADLERQVVERSRERALTWQVSPDMLSVMNPDGFFERTNPAWQAALGWSEEELAGVRYADFVHPGDREKSEAAYDMVKRGEPVLRFENRYRRKDGAYLWLSWVAVPEGGKFYCSARDITAEKEQAAALAERTAERDRAWRNSRDLLVVIGADGIFRAINPAWTAILGHEPVEVIGRSFLEFIWPEDADFTQGGLETAAAKRDLTDFENRYRHKDGNPRWISWRTSVEGDLVYADGRHVTAEKEAAEALARTEEQLRQAQKMEAVGQLTGGIAHDFNNLLTGIVGSLDLMLTRIAQGRTEHVERYAKAAMSSANRAAALTHRLLAFARRQPLDPKPVNVNHLVASMEDLLRRSLGEAIAMELVTAGGLWMTLCDPHQLESAILNLAINARDAMPEGGKLTIETANSHLDDAYAAAQRDVTPGQYVAICVTDTGTGMSPDLIARAFDPFFTTKPIGQGTGLGLSMVYGFTKQSEGHTRIYSEVGKGTTMRIYLPRHRGVAEEETGNPTVTDVPRAEAGETVLVVEDEPVVRNLIVEVLQDLGYRALEAADGPAGLKLLQSKRRIDLLVSDVGLPGLNGRQMADQARERRPDLKILFITGYAENATMANGFLEPGMEMITKPFAIEALATRIRAIIERGVNPRRPAGVPIAGTVPSSGRRGECPCRDRPRDSESRTRATRSSCRRARR